MKKTLHAWWSEQMAKVVRNTAIYATPDGREIEVCQVTDTPEHHTQWPDMVYLGKVTCWIRTGRVNHRSVVVRYSLATGDE